MAWHGRARAAKFSRMQGIASRNTLIAVLVLAVGGLTFLLYAPALDAQAISFDDDEYLLDNSLVQNPSWASTRDFLTEVLEPSSVRGYYQPLAMISLMLDYARGGRTNNLRPFHVTSVLIHVASTLLVFALILQLVGQPWIAAALSLVFGVHPLAIESIPWIAERKTLLATFFALLSLLIYIRYARAPSLTKYGLGLLTFALALMSKPSATPLPIFMVLLDYWPLKRLTKRSLIEKIPFFALAGISAIITFLSQHKTYGTGSLYQESAWGVPMVMSHNIVFYLLKFIWPGELSWYYEYPQPFSFSHPAVLRGVIGTLVLIAALVVSLRWTRAWVMGFLFFFFGLLPTMSGVTFFGLIAADRFVYLPSVGLLITLAWILHGLVSKQNPWLRFGCFSILSVWIILLGTSTHRHLQYWKDSETLSRHMARMSPNCATTRIGLANALLAKGRPEEAIPEYEEAIRLAPGESASHTGLGTALTQVGAADRAIPLFREAIRIEPDNVRAMNNLGSALAKKGRHQEALALFASALEHRPRYVQSMLNSATSLAALGQIEEAIAACQKAARLTPDNQKTHQHLGNMYLQKGAFDEAIAAFRQAISLDGVSVGAVGGLGKAYLAMKKSKEAEAAFREAIIINPSDPEWHSRLGDALAQQGKLEAATSAWNAALRLNPGHPGALVNLANALFMQGQMEEAIVRYQEALKSRPDDATALGNLAQAYLAVGKLEEAVARFNSAIESSPSDADLRYGLGTALQQLNRSQEALVQYTEAVRLNPRFIEARNNLGAALADENKLDEAAAQYQTALQLDPRVAVLHANLADVRVRQGQITEAVKHYREAVRLAPDNVELRFRLGESLQMAGANDEALTQFREVLRLDPKHAEAQAKVQALSPG